MDEAAPMQLTNPRRLRALAGAAVLVALGSLAVGACGSQPAASPGASTSSTSAAPGAGGPTTSTTVPCPHLTASAMGGGAVVLDTAALLTATITVHPQSSGSGDPGAATPTCVVLRPGAKLQLFVGQRVEFVANHPPRLAAVLGAAGAGAGAVGMSTSPGPTTTGPAGGPATEHLVIALTALRPGAVNVTWTDCSGTAC